MVTYINKKMCVYDVPNYYAYCTTCGRNYQNRGKPKDLRQDEKRNTVECLAQDENSIEVPTGL